MRKLIFFCFVLVWLCSSAYAAEISYTENHWGMRYYHIPISITRNNTDFTETPLSPENKKWHFWTRKNYFGVGFTKQNAPLGITKDHISLEFDRNKPGGEDIYQNILAVRDGKKESYTLIMELQNNEAKIIKENPLEILADPDYGIARARMAFGQYIPYTGPLHEEDLAAAEAWRKKSNLPPLELEKSKKGVRY